VTGFCSMSAAAAEATRMGWLACMRWSWQVLFTARCGLPRRSAVSRVSCKTKRCLAALGATPALLALIAAAAQALGLLRLS
jgi:hypothetical protein